MQPVVEEALRLPVPGQGSHHRRGARRRSLLMTKDTTFQHVGSTLPFPRKHVIGVFDSLQEGEQAVQALVDAGYHAGDIAFIPSQNFPSAFHEHLRKEGLFRQIIHYLQLTSVLSCSTTVLALSNTSAPGRLRISFHQSKAPRDEGLFHRPCGKASQLIP